MYIYIIILLMGKFTAAIGTWALRLGNTVATPLRRWGELGNGLANIPRQWYSSTKNIAEVSKQTLNALADNFLNFSKVDGKWYQKMLKVPLNAVSACTRRPFMIAGAGLASGLNQWVREPFKKLLTTPKMIFKGIKNATRIFSKKKWFEFQSYDTHETTGDTWVNAWKEQRIGVLWAKIWASEQTKEEPAPKTKSSHRWSKKWWSEKKEEIVKKKDQKINDTKNEISISEYKSEAPASVLPTPIPEPKSIEQLQQKNIQESQEKEQKEQSENFPTWKTLDPKIKAGYKKEYDKLLKNNTTKDGIIARGKEAKMWDTPEEIIKNFKEKDPTFVGYMEEILSKSA